MKTEDGGPAFPQDLGANSWGVKVVAPGMSLRDYFAIHATQPGAMEIADLAGVRCKGSNAPWSEDCPTFDDWWRTVPNAERYRLTSIAKYIEADAMLAARQPRKEGTP